jgi:hypothetical protein
LGDFENHEVQFEIVFKREFAFYAPIHTLRFQSEKNDIVEQLVEHYGKADLVIFLKEFLSLFLEIK